MTKSAYSGYMPSFSEDPEALRRAEARGVAKLFKNDYEGMRSSYEAGRQKGDPLPSAMEPRLRSADEKAVRLMQLRHEDARREAKREDKRFERQRQENMGAGAGRGRINPPMAKQTDDEEYRKGGKTKGYAKGGVTRADGCAQRGKTRGVMR